MIISRTPLRISFVGGGTDLPDFADHHGGAVVSTAINKWVHVVVAPRFEGDSRVSYSQTEIVATAREVKHELVREALRVTGLPQGLDIATLADVPSRGTGLGSSSAVMVGLLAALYAYQGIFRSQPSSPRRLLTVRSMCSASRSAGRINTPRRWAASTSSSSCRAVACAPSPLSPPRNAGSAASLAAVCSTRGASDASADVLAGQKAAIIEGRTTQTLQTMRDLAHEMRDALGAGDVTVIGDLLHRNWELKRSLATRDHRPDIDAWYELRSRPRRRAASSSAPAAAAFLLVCVSRGSAGRQVRAALAELREVPFRFASRGVHIPLFEPVDML